MFAKNRPLALDWRQSKYLRYISKLFSEAPTSETVGLRFLKSYFKVEILMFLSFVVSIVVDMFN